MSKKLLSVVLALALALSCFAVGAFAIGDIGYESEEDAAFYTQAWALSADPTDIGGGKYTVDVYLTANYGVGPIQFQILKNVTAGTLTLTDAVAGEAIPQEWEANVAFEDTTGEVIINPDPADEGAYAIDEPSNAHIATLTFTASADVAATIAINVADAKNAENVGGTLIAARISDGNVVTGAAITGQTVSQDTNTVTFGKTVVEYTVSFNANGGSGEIADVKVESGKTYTLPACTFTAPSGYEFKAWSVGGAEKAVGDTITVTANTTVTALWLKSVVPPTLVAIEDTLGVVDTSRTELSQFDGTSCDGYVYGLDPDLYGDVTEIVQVVGDGEMNVVENESGITTGTGAMIQVLDLDGNVVAEYVLIVFGDVNGDGYADSNDANNIEQHENLELGDNGELETYLQFAGDVNCDDYADSNDANNIEQHENLELGELGVLDIAGIVDHWVNN